MTKSLPTIAAISSTHSDLWDTAIGYGRLTRFLHWTMAGLLAVQFVSTALRLLARESFAYSLLWPLHSQIGFALLLLAVLRGGWGVLNLANRPGQRKGLHGQLATFGHFVLYVFMFLVPSLAILRTVGAGRSFSFLGLSVIPAREIEIGLLVEIGNTAHGPAAWLFLVIILGHTLMAVYHRTVLRDLSWYRIMPTRTKRMR